MSECRIDTQSYHWFQCSRGTVGCPVIHDGRTPHCIACADENTECISHAEPVLEESLAEYAERTKNFGA
jgi:hypothetical protein